MFTNYSFLLGAWKALHPQSADSGCHARLQRICLLVPRTGRQIHTDRKNQETTRALNSTLVVHRELQANSCKGYRYLY